MGHRLGKINSPAAVFMTAAAIILGYLIFFVWAEIKYKTFDPQKISIIECISAACEELDVFPGLAISIFFVESSLLSKHKEYKKWEQKGRFYVYSIPQISYATAYAEGFRKEPDALLDYTEAIYWGVKHIKTLLYVYDGNTCKAIMAYNAGDAVSMNYEYLNKVLIQYRNYYPNFECEE